MSLKKEGIVISDRSIEVFGDDTVDIVDWLSWQESSEKQDWSVILGFFTLDTSNIWEGIVCFVDMKMFLGDIVYGLYN